LLLLASDRDTIRAVTHLGVSEADVDRAIKILREVAAKPASA
jgi:DNA-binding transcriptional regulator YdaS (Cro superfamily)